MRVLVISDTHIPAVADKLPSIIEKEAKMSDCCLHTGDFISIEAFNELSSWVKIYGVLGNMDEIKLSGKVSYKQIIKLEQVKIAMIHGRGAPGGLIEYVNKEFAKNFSEIDIFVFGHSHLPLNEERDSKIYFNPGSPTDKMFAPYNSYGILDIEGKNIKRRIEKIG
ncbi:MAG: YfcE family phosphodiesterase [Candidatus Omnitrophota bacterium]|nr:YfcE family phosphodiesterase [Candidatus Omnitrophota bacterium]